MSCWTFDNFHIFIKKIGEAVLPNGFQNGSISIREAASSEKPQPEKQLLSPLLFAQKNKSPEAQSKLSN